MREFEDQQEVDQERGLAAAVVDALGFPAALVDGARNVIHRNPPFVEFLATGSGERMLRRVQLKPIPPSGVRFLMDAGDGSAGPRIVGLRLLGDCGPEAYLLTVSADVRGGATDPDPRRLNGDITAAEQAVLFGMLDGHSLSDIARQRGTKVSTVRWHLKNLQSKLGVSDKAEVVAWIARSPVCWLAHD